MTIALRLVRSDDLETIRHWRMMPDITRYMYSDPQISSVDQRRWFDQLCKSTKDMAWIIQADLDGPLGLLTLGDIDTTHRRCNWAYYIAEEAGRGKGLAKTLECNIADFVFETLSLNKLWCEVLAFNDRVVSIHEKFGSKVEGTFRSHIQKNNEWHDVIRMGLLKEDWMALRPALNYSTIEIEIPEQK